MRSGFMNLNSVEASSLESVDDIRVTVIPIKIVITFFFRNSTQGWNESDKYIYLRVRMYTYYTINCRAEETFLILKELYSPLIF